ncbi:ABC transporter ATP-binding protein [Acidithiobacillus ferrooxidans F221]|uniref:ABC transporter ATP-binding protein n=1 Tax=Acidithiobacillus ferrooxidans TaxID=920 RepID=UPI001C07142E|nr:ABC transporter ATP-binding protein [Acidithiobacillus ferrooxidans]MBU2809644.1 ABC transporter ATP-binding protein [Acidithiobacillus ferrooxidans F221]
MIELCEVTKTYPIHHGRAQRTILGGINLCVGKGEKWGILGRNGAGKSTLIRLISGAEKPNAGKIVRNMTVSWPLAFGGTFQGSLTGRDNTKLICRAYGVDFDKTIAMVENFAELGNYLWEPVKSYSSGMSARLAFAISMSVEFDCFLIDEALAVGDHRFLQKCNLELFENRGERAMIIVSHQADVIRAHCEHAAVLENGRLTVHESVDSAIAAYEAL